MGIIDLGNHHASFTFAVSNNHITDGNDMRRYAGLRKVRLHGSDIPKQPVMPANERVEKGMMRALLHFGRKQCRRSG